MSYSATYATNKEMRDIALGWVKWLEKNYPNSPSFEKFVNALNKGIENKTNYERTFNEFFWIISEHIDEMVAAGKITSLTDMPPYFEYVRAFHDDFSITRRPIKAEE